MVSLDQYVGRMQEGQECIYHMAVAEGNMELKWQEIYNYEHTPHPIEYQMYYSV